MPGLKKRVWKMTFFGLKWARIEITGRDTSTKNSQEYLPCEQRPFYLPSLCSQGKEYPPPLPPPGSSLVFSFSSKIALSLSFSIIFYFLQVYLPFLYEKYPVHSYSHFVRNSYRESWDWSSNVKNHESQSRTINYQFKKQGVLNWKCLGLM